MNIFLYYLFLLWCWVTQTQTHIRAMENTVSQQAKDMKQPVSFTLLPLDETWFDEALITGVVWLLSSVFHNQPQTHRVKKQQRRDAATDWRQREGTMGSCNNGTGWNKPQCICPSAPPSEHTLPMWNHLMHVLLLSLVNHNWGRGRSLLPSPCMWGRVLRETCKRVLDLLGVFTECEKVLRALCGAWSGKERVRGWCLWGCKKGWAGDVSVGGTGGEKGMQGMSEHYRSVERGASISSLEMTKKIKQAKVEGKNIFSGFNHQPMIHVDDHADVTEKYKWFAFASDASLRQPSMALAAKRTNEVQTGNTLNGCYLHL